MRKLQDTLCYPPRLMNADRAAAYVGLSKTKFLDEVSSGRYPPAKSAAEGCPRWDRIELDAAVDALDQHKKGQSHLRTLDDLLESEDGESEPAIRQ